MTDPKRFVPLGYLDPRTAALRDAMLDAGPDFYDRPPPHLDPTRGNFNCAGRYVMPKPPAPSWPADVKVERRPIPRRP